MDFFGLFLWSIDWVESSSPSEIGDFECTVFIDEEVFHFEVAMTDFSALVKKGEAVQDLFENEA